MSFQKQQGTKSVLTDSKTVKINQKTAKRGGKIMSLQKVRTEKGMSQKELSEKSKVSLRSIQGYEQGLRNINGIHLKTLCDLAKALDCKIEDLLTDEALVRSYKSVR